MTYTLIALGSNLGDRQGQLQAALGEMARLAGTQIAARSAWRETPPVGGPSGQGLFLNGAALLRTQRLPPTLLAELRRIEASLGRERRQRWGARTLDLDILLAGHAQLDGPRLQIPHPRMAFRRFVLEPAAAVAPWMVHSESQWTVQALLRQLNEGADRIAVASSDAASTNQWAGALADRLGLPVDGQAGDPRRPSVSPWSLALMEAAGRRPKLILALADCAGVDAHSRRRMLGLPATGPVAWISPAGPDDPLEEAVAAAHSVWPALAGGSLPTHD
jgi:2-amino-4-hydroxy-6-hydroxymethyldihydropteridine diphosphokinase